MNDTAAKLQGQLPYWEHLSDSEKSTLISNSKVVRFTAGQNVRGIGSEPGVMLIQSGTLRSYLLSEDGKVITVHWPKAGDACAFSTAQINFNLDFELNIDAHEDSEVLIIPADVFMRVAKKNIYVANYINEMSAQCLSYVAMAMKNLLFISLSRRLADFLINAADESGSNEIYITHEQIAEAIGSAREVVSRALKRMEHEGSVELFRGGVRVIDWELLPA
jgi:CRP/FNR family transcriptional regulator